MYKGCAREHVHLTQSPQELSFGGFFLLNKNMKLFEILSSTTLDSPAFKNWFSGSKVVDSSGYPMPVYHGAGRPDRVGTRFRKSRATAGPMSYFTENPDLASSYAENKPDTSHEVENYSDWFQVKIGKTKTNIERAWYSLPRDEQMRIAALAPRVTMDDDDHIILGDQSVTSGNGGYRIAMHRGNALAALFDAWVAGGSLYNEEERFLEVLKLAGMTTPVMFEHPYVTYPFVYQVFLSIKHPLITTAIPKEVIDSLSKVAKQQRKNQNSNAFHDQWNKKYNNAAEWIRGLLDSENYTWTVIPDWVTNVLKTHGYDGIKDIGGKMSGELHTVWIPFEEYQVKSAISNKNFDPTKTDIHK